MTLLNILRYPDPRLRTQAKTVTRFDNKLVKFTDDLLETMYAAPGIGLAATQVDVHEMIIAVDVSEHQQRPCLLVNPQLTLLGNVIETEEGCLSVPGFYESVARSDKIAVQAQSPTGEDLNFEAEGLLAVCIQHECDHLLGKLFVDYLSTLKRNWIRKKLVKQQKRPD